MDTQRVSDIERARDAAARESWAEAYELLRALDTAHPGESGGPGTLGPDDLNALADAAWWTGRTENSITVRLRAYARYSADGSERRAGYTAWMLFYDYRDTGRTATAAGWLRRARQHLSGEPECAEQCYLAWMEAEEAQQRGEHAAAVAAAQRMTRIARRCGHRDLLAMSLQVHGSVLLANGRAEEGLALLDDAMCAVTAGELSSLFTGWIYCLALTQSMAAADLERAAEWTEAAMRWCADPATDNPFRGLCRVHRVQVLELRGDWPRAQAEASLVCEEVAAANSAVAGEAHYIAGEIHRRRGELEAAEAAFARAHELGRGPQPGLALLRLAQGKGDAAAAGLRLTLARQRDAGDTDPLGLARLVAAQVEVALAGDDIAAARAAADELDTLAGRGEDGGGAVTLLRATAAHARGAVALAEHSADSTDEGGQVLEPLHRALAYWLELRVPYEAAQVRMLLAAACRAAGDHEGARMELRAARSTFEQLGSLPDARRAAALLGEETRRLPGRLTRREAEVLRLVAAGRTNRDIAAALTISEHTVARHLNNIFAKLDVTSRAAATAYAYTHDLA